MAKKKAAGKKGAGKKPAKGKKTGKKGKDKGKGKGKTAKAVPEDTSVAPTVADEKLSARNPDEAKGGGLLDVEEELARYKPWMTKKSAYLVVASFLVLGSMVNTIATLSIAQNRPRLRPFTVKQNTTQITKSDYESWTPEAESVSRKFDSSYKDAHGNKPKPPKGTTAKGFRRSSQSWFYLVLISSPAALIVPSILVTAYRGYTYNKSRHRKPIHDPTYMSARQHRRAARADNGGALVMVTSPDDQSSTTSEERIMIAARARQQAEFVNSRGTWTPLSYPSVSSLDSIGARVDIGETIQRAAFKYDKWPSQVTSTTTRMSAVGRPSQYGFIVPEITRDSAITTRGAGSARRSTASKSAKSQNNEAASSPTLRHRRIVDFTSDDGADIVTTTQGEKDNFGLA